MKCDKIKELILTDYIDDQLDLKIKREVTQHIASCEGCKRYLESVKKYTIDTFSKDAPQTPPDEIWQNIEENIKTRQSKRRLIDIRELFYLRPSLKRGVFAFATVAAMLLMMVSFYIGKQSTRKNVNIYLSDQADFLYSLGGNNGNGELLLNDSGFKTGIEEYFL